MRSRALLVAISAAVLAGATLSQSGSGRPVPGAAKCPIFPRSSHWNQRVDRLPVLPNSTAMVNAVGASRTSHADFGSGLYEGGPIGIPYTVVTRRQRRVPVSFEYADESDRGPSPIRVVPGQDGTAHCVLVIRYTVPSLARSTGSSPILASSSARLKR